MTWRSALALCCVRSPLCSICDTYVRILTPVSVVLTPICKPVEKRNPKRSHSHSARSEAQSRNPPRPPVTRPRYSAEGAAQFQPRATPWEIRPMQKRSSPEGAAHSSPTNGLRSVWIALSGLVVSDRHDSQGDALGFRGSPRWGLFTPRPLWSPMENATRSAVTVIPRGAKRSRGIHPDHQTPARGRAEGTAQFQPRATPVGACLPDHIRHPTPTRSVRRVSETPGNRRSNFNR
jgi:hypothetical protein